MSVYASGNPEGTPLSAGAIARLADASPRTVQRHVTHFIERGALPKLGLTVERDKRPGLDAEGRPHSQLTRYGLRELADSEHRTLVWRSVIEWPAYRAATPAARGIYWLVAELCGPSGRRASAQHLANLAGCSTSCIRKAIAYWRDHGLIDVTQQANAKHGHLANILRVVPPSAALAKGQAGRPGAATQRSAAALADLVGLALAQQERSGGDVEAFHGRLEAAVAAASEPERLAARRAVERRIREAVIYGRRQLGMTISSRVNAVAHAMVQPLYELWPTYVAQADAMAERLAQAEEAADRAEVVERQRVKMARGGRDFGAEWVGEWQPPGQEGARSPERAPDTGEWTAALAAAFDCSPGGIPWGARSLTPAGVMNGALVLVVPQAYEVDLLLDNGHLPAIQRAAGGRVAFRLQGEHDRLAAEAIRARFVDAQGVLSERWRSWLVGQREALDALRERFDALPPAPEARIGRPGFREAVRLTANRSAARDGLDKAFDVLARTERALLWTADSVSPEPAWAAAEADVAALPDLVAFAALSVGESA